MRTTRRLLLLPLAVFVAACADDAPVETTAPEVSAALVGSSVASEADLQAALDDASAAATPSTIRLQPGATIALSAPLTHDGAAPIEIDGRDATITGPDAGNALEFTGGADLSIRDLTVEGAAEHGIYVAVPLHREGTQSVSVRGVTVRDNGFAGLWVDDQMGEDGDGSPASVSVRILRSVFSGNNIAGLDENGQPLEMTYEEILAVADKDGVRVNEGGTGDLHLFIQDSQFFGNQADAVEADETGDGDVHSRVLNSDFNDNGEQAQFPFDVIPVGYEAIEPGEIGPDGDYADALEEYQGEGRDLEDGFDIDENDEGSVYSHFVNVTANGNEDEGIDLDETYDGSVEMSGDNIVANDNFGAGIQITESEEEPGTDGDIVLNLSNVTANDSRDSRGIRLEEFFAGDVLGQVVRGTFDGNDSDGFRIEQIDDGAIDFRFVNTAFTNNGGEGLQLEEAGTVTLVNPTFGGNDEDVDADGVEVIYRGR